MNCPQEGAELPRAPQAHMAQTWLPQEPSEQEELAASALHRTV